MAVDRKALAEALSEASQTVHHVLDRRTGKILTLNLQDPRSVADVQKRIAADKARYLQIPKPKGRANFEAMERFIAQMQDPHFKEVLKRKLTSHRPFREFRDALDTKPMEKRAWEKFDREFTDRRVNEFLKSYGLS